MKLRDTGWNIGDFIEFKDAGEIKRGTMLSVVNGTGFMLVDTGHEVYLFRHLDSVDEVFENV